MGLGLNNYKGLVSDSFVRIAVEGIFKSTVCDSNLTLLVIFSLFGHVL